VAVTLSDVAVRARVSVKTVSNVVSGYVHVSPATRRRVQRALDELGYQPNLSARNLRGGRSGVIALAVPGLSAYFAELARLVERAVAEAGYTLLVDQTEALHERESQVVRGIRAQLVDGLIFSPSALNGAAIATNRSATPLVLLGERVLDGLVDHVAIDNVAAAHEVVKHLIKLGRRRIAALGVLRSESAGTAGLRRAGYAAALEEAGIPARRNLLIPVDASDRLEGLYATRRLLSSGARPDAIFAFNDELAFGVLRALYEAHVRVPDDIAVAGFDDVEEAGFSVPTLTTISPDKQLIARCAVTNLVERMSGRSEAPPRDVVVPHRLERRESTLGFRPTPDRPERQTAGGNGKRSVRRDRPPPGSGHRKPPEP
jgi:DNA-binding LacI/PurR family transcriptional regulator